MKCSIRKLWRYKIIIPIAVLVYVLYVIRLTMLREDTTVIEHLGDINEAAVVQHHRFIPSTMKVRIKI